MGVADLHAARDATEARGNDGQCYHADETCGAVGPQLLGLQGVQVGERCPVLACRRQGVTLAATRRGRNNLKAYLLHVGLSPALHSDSQLALC